MKGRAMERDRTGVIGTVVAAGGLTALLFAIWWV
jgi:hypothetical protein